MRRTALSVSTIFMAVAVVLPMAANADAGAGKPSPAPKSGDGIVYNAGGCPAGQIRQYPDGGAGPGSDCGSWKLDPAVIVYIHIKPHPMRNVYFADAFPNCDDGGASRSMEIYD